MNYILRGFFLSLVDHVRDVIVHYSNILKGLYYMFDYYDDEDFYPQPNPPHIKQLIRDLDSILDNKSIKVFTDFDSEDGYNHIRINAFAKMHGSCFLKLYPKPNITNENSKWDVDVHIYNYETSFFEWDDTISNVTLENLAKTVKEIIDKIRKDDTNEQTI